VTSAIFVYISEAKVRLGAILSSISRSSAMFVYVLRNLFTSCEKRHICLHTTSFVYNVKVRLGAIQSGVSRSSAMFLYVLRHLLTMLKLG